MHVKSAVTEAQGGRRGRRGNEERRQGEERTLHDEQVEESSGKNKTKPQFSQIHFEKLLSAGWKMTEPISEKEAEPQPEPQPDFHHFTIY